VQGVLQYGYGSWDEIFADESLGFPDDIGKSSSPYICAFLKFSVLCKEGHAKPNYFI